MNKVDQYKSYDAAFNDMKSMTAINAPFKLVFVKEDGKLKIVPKALMRKRTPVSKDSMSPYKFNFVDVTQDAFGSAYIPCLVSVNDKQIVLQ